MKLDGTVDSRCEDATVLTREVHVATYKGEIEAMSYSDSSSNTLVNLPVYGSFSKK
jgi:hypothetical protein